MVLATDMSLHFQQIKEMKQAVVKPDTLDRGSTMAFIVHAADISHPTKVWELHIRWTDGLVEEFFRQVNSALQNLDHVRLGRCRTRTWHSIFTTLRSGDYDGLTKSDWIH